MEHGNFRAVELVREIRDQLYEETKDLSPEELRVFIAREAAKINQSTTQHPSGQSAA